RIFSNTIFDVDYGVYVPDNGSVPGVSSTAGTIFDMTSWNVAADRIRLPAAYDGTVVDLGSGIRSTDLSSVLLVTTDEASQVSYSWSGRLLNVSASVGGSLSFVSPAAGGASYALSNGQGSPFVFPFPAQVAPLIFPAIALVLLAVSFVLVRFRRRGRREPDHEDSIEEDREGDSG